MSQRPPDISRRIERIWYGGSKLAWLLLPLAGFFRAAVAVRRNAYRLGLARRIRCGVPVIVVGNLTVGGAGKTPIVGWLARRLAADGRRVGILSRGYGGRAGQRPTMVGADADAAHCGDEAVLLARDTGLPVCVAVDRVAGARRLVADAGVDIIVCDDGLQHYRLARDVEIAVVDGARGFGNGFMLPAGPLREPPSRLREVDCVLVNGNGMPVAGRHFDLQPAGARELRGSATRALSTFAGARVWAVAGIGNPARFAGLLEAAGIRVDLVDVPDHGRVDLAELQAERAQPILMTAKDAVKYGSRVPGDAWYVPVGVAMSSADEEAVLQPIHALYE